MHEGSWSLAYTDWDVDFMMMWGAWTGLNEHCELVTAMFRVNRYWFQKDPISLINATMPFFPKDASFAFYLVNPQNNEAYMCDMHDWMDENDGWNRVLFLFSEETWGLVSTAQRNPHTVNGGTNSEIRVIQAPTIATGHYWGIDERVHVFGPIDLWKAGMDPDIRTRAVNSRIKELAEARNMADWQMREKLSWGVTIRIMLFYFGKYSMYEVIHRIGIHSICVYFDAWCHRFGLEDTAIEWYPLKTAWKH